MDPNWLILFPKIAGQKHYVVSHPQHVSSVFKASKSLTFDGSTADVLKMIYDIQDEPGITVEEMLKGGKLLPDGTTLEDPHSFFRRQLSGKALHDLTERAILEIESVLDAEFDRLPGEGSEDVGFLIWARNLLSDAVTAAAWGPMLLKKFPRLVDALWELDDGTYKLMYGVPKMFAKEVYSAREELVDALRAYLGDNVDGQKMREHGLPLVLGLQESYKAAGISLDGRARCMLTILQAYVSLLAMKSAFTDIVVLGSTQIVPQLPSGSSSTVS